MVYDKVDEVIHDFFESFLSRHQTDLEKLMEGSDFFFDWVDFMYYKFHKIDLKRCASYIDSPVQTKIEKSIINLNNYNDKSFQYAATAA